MQQLRSYIGILCYTAIFSVSLSACHKRLHAFATPLLNQSATDGQGRPSLLGPSDPEKLEQPPFDSWFVKNYNNYQIDTATAIQLKAQCNNKKFLIFMGTWCGDSQREVPRILKILSFCQVSPANIRIVMVSDRDSTYKQSPGHEEKDLHIVRVPDLIVFENNREIGRIIESPVASLEKDGLAITSHQPYQPNYAASLLLARRFDHQNPGQLKTSLPALADSLRPRPKSAGELNSLAHALRAAGKPELADIAVQLNNLLFPAANRQ